jgi:ribosome-binding protein aMBF1 (putative translation factor)
MKKELNIKNNKKIDFSKMIDHDEFMKEQFAKRPGLKEAYDKTEMELIYHRTFIEAREKKGLTQKELAMNLGVAQPALARFESGRSNPTVASLSKFLRSLGLKLKIVPA